MTAVKFELNIYGLTRKDAEELLTELVTHEAIAFEEKLFHLEKDFGGQLGKLRVNPSEGQTTGYYDASHDADPEEYGQSEHLRISFVEERHPELRSGETQSIEELSAKTLGLQVLKEKIKSIRDLDVEFRMS